MTKKTFEATISGGCLVMCFLLIFVAMVCNACAQSAITLKYRWDKNTEEDMSHYDLFRVTQPDSAQLWNLAFWPEDTTRDVYPDSAIHYQFDHYLARIAHIFSPIDSLTFEYDQQTSNNWLRAWICAVDSAGNKSLLAPSINAVWIADTESPERPRTYELVFRKD